MRISLIKKRLCALKAFFEKKSLRKKLLQEAVARFYSASSDKKSKIPKISLSNLLSANLPLFLIDSPFKEGQTSFYEHFILASLTKHISPKTILEIGTFDGKTTAIFALNSPPECKIHTLDLEMLDGHCILKEDEKYVQSPLKAIKHYDTLLEKTKIREHKGNSLTYPFENFIQKDTFCDLIFIDGGHSYNVVKNDTEKALKVLAKGGIILWHDYDPNMQEVFFYLNELSQNYPLKHIEGSSIVHYKKA